MWGIIGGTGFEKLKDVEFIEELPRETPFGLTSPGFSRISINGVEALYIPRHGTHHEIAPSDINCRANIFALKLQGVKRLVTFSAVGSLREELKPGTCVIPSQFINYTRFRKHVTFNQEGVVGHVALACPIWMEASKCLEQARKPFPFSIQYNRTYICIEGPTFSTQAESKNYRMLGADIVGMTAYPEYALAREAGISYLPVCFVTDYDCWDDDLEHVSIEVILSILKQNTHWAIDFFEKLSEMDLPEDQALIHNTLGECLLTKEEGIGEKQRAWLDVLRCSRAKL